MSTPLLIALGAFFGAPLRYYLDHQFRRRLAFPGGILLVNISGSFLLGLISKASSETWALVGIGFAGAFTTWSAFALDLNKDLRHPRRFLGNVCATLILGILAAGLGRALAG
jgi:CrcB protein